MELRGKYERTKEHRAKIGNANRQRIIKDSTKEKCRVAHLKENLTEETRKKMSTWQIGKKQTESTRKKISDALKKKIELDPNWGKRTSEMLRGKKHTPEHNRRVSEGLKGKICSEETRKRIGDAQRGEKSRWWNGGSSYYPYCELFNNDFKIRARTYYNYTCVECGSYGNCVHHVHYDKKMCCNGSPQDVVVLCKSCHGKANFNRDYWEKYFTDMIYGYYQGKSFFTKEEMLKYRGLNMESV